MILKPAVRAQALLDRLVVLDFIPSLLLRVYLAPIFWMAGAQKAAHFPDTVAWFGNAEWGLGLPFPAVMALLATAAELGGAVCLVLGFALRWMCIPMMLTMLVAAFTVHWQNGWLAIAEGMGAFSNMRTMEAHKRLEEAKEILMQHGDWDYLTEYGNFVILNNGVEFAVTYFIMLLALAFLGAGRYVSLDYWIRKRFMPRAAAATA
jgi:putative oxidoreductase